MALPEAFWEYGEIEERNGKEQRAENIRMQSQELLNVSGHIRKYLLEVKGCTLERDGIGYFPDAPTERGVNHLR